MGALVCILASVTMMREPFSLQCPSKFFWNKGLPENRTCDNVQEATGGGA